MDNVSVWFKCNGAFLHINEVSETLDSEWGSEQCEGCGEDIVATGTIKGLRGTRLSYGAVVKCRCGASYPIHFTIEDRPWRSHDERAT